MIILKKMKKHWEMYPIGSPKGALNTKRVPKFTGILKFKENSDEFTINKFIVKNENDEKLTPPSEAIKLLKSQVVFLSSRDKKIEEFLESLNIDIHFTKICQHCSFEGNITIINSKFSYNHLNQTICKVCAEETIKRELKLNGFDKKSFNNFKRILHKTGSLDKTLSAISPKFDPLANSNLTLFDKIKVDKHESFPKIELKRLKIPENFKNILLSEKNEYLLPVQYLAIKNGLLKGENLLVSAATASGKTLIAELAGIPKAMKGKKFIFLTPLVALANQKYRDFKKKYEPLGLNVSIKVGMNRIKAKEELKIPNANVSNSDIIVGTYEGIDFLLRSGKSHDLGDVGVVVIDEIHMIDDEDRGVGLNGLIKRIENIFPKSQIIGLSATVKNSKQISNSFNMKLVEYDQRPVPLERHLIFIRNELEKRNLIKKLVIGEFHRKSSKGFSGQTIIFTNSRRKTHKIADFLNKSNLNVSPYHAGLSYFKKEKIEKNFSKGKIAAVVTTAALAAGVDFPASQVIFETLLMGNKWINPNEFSQMIGRAGRPTFHDRGVVYLLPELSNQFDGESEESIAISLLESDVENVHVDYNEENILEQVLADICSYSLKTLSEAFKFYKNIPIPIEIDKIINELYDKKLIKMYVDVENKSKNEQDNKSKNDYKILPTKYGKAISMSFLAIEDGEFIKKSLNDKNFLKNNNFYFFNKFGNSKKKYSKKQKSKTKAPITNKNNKTNKTNTKNIDNKKFNTQKKNLEDKNSNDIYLKILNIALALEYFENAYLSPVLHKQIANALKINFSTRLFSQSTLDIISSGDTIGKVDKKFQEALLKIQVDFLKCLCKDKPFCDCLQNGISSFIINERLKKKDPIDISKKLFRLYQIQTYPGDIFSWLDKFVRNLEAVERVVKAYNNKKYINTAKKLIKLIENG